MTTADTDSMKLDKTCLASSVTLELAKLIHEQYLKEENIHEPRVELDVERKLSEDQNENLQCNPRTIFELHHETQHGENHS